MSKDWRTIDFRPLSPGWRAVYLEPVSGVFTKDVPGVLVQEESEIDHNYDEWPVDKDVGDRHRRAEPSGWDGTSLDTITDSDNFWMILGPTDREPDAAEEVKEREYRSAVKARRAPRAPA